MTRQHRPLLYLSLGEPLQDNAALACFERTVARVRPAAIRLPLGDIPTVQQQIDLVRNVCIDHDVAMIATDCPDYVTALGCDGVHMSDATQDIAAIRSKLSRDSQLGVYCGQSRDQALRAGEAGADYIAISPESTDFAAWWLEMMELPLVAENVETPQCAQTVATLGIDFLNVAIAFTKGEEDVIAKLSALGFSA